MRTKRAGSERRQRTRGLLIPVGAGLCAVLMLVIWLRSSTLESEFSVPNPTLPSPNAFDLIVSAGNSVIDETTVGYAMGNGGKHVYSSSADRKLVTENSAVLAKLRAALKERYWAPPARSFWAQFPYWAKERNLARLLRLEASVQRRAGNWGRAVKIDIDCIHLGVEVPHGSIMIGDLTGISCESLGRFDVWGSVDHLDAAQAKAAVHALEQLEPDRVSFADTLQEEKWFFTASLLQSFHYTAELEELLGQFSSAPHSIGVVFFISHPKRTILNGYIDYIDQSIANVRLPYAAHLKPPAVPADPICRNLVLPYPSAFMKHVENRTQDALLITTLALRACHAERGAYPANLSSLVPGYLKVVPNDPYALNAPLRYKLHGARYLLYSVGPDGRDDGGKPIDNPSAATAASKSARYYVNERSTGDVVAGANIW